jgi:hypothetical protein
LLDCHHRPASRTAAIGIVFQVSLEDRFQHELGGGLSGAAKFNPSNFKW